LREKEKKNADKTKDTLIRLKKKSKGKVRVEKHHLKMQT